MQAWWDTLTIFEKVFWMIALPFSLIFFIQLVLTLFGMGGSTDPGVDSLDHGGDIPHDHDISNSADDAAPAFSVFTIRNFIAFFTVFGWAGLAANHYGLNHMWSILIAVVLGVAAMFLVSSLFFFIMKLADSGNMNINNAIGQTGKVYLPIKANSGNTGKVHVTVQDGLREISAITKGPEDLATGTIIKVTGIASDDVLIVEKV